MAKEVRSFKIDYPLDWSYSVEIKKLREDLEAIEKLGATHVEIEPWENYGSASVTICSISERMETDEEFIARELKEKHRQEEIKQRELKELERLKSKYG